ncbi:hypothetical protein N7448_010594 [Penicillium atrosanguineum]|uniref:Uncharacterized protein n=1 Tax=Penicillium atrosanguineum TaxID=1132637 RepID=A0A9W9PM65_9EURO|nr:hypothetical protein N7526_010524 [Penicillium atrosanguineum]KAJ5119925.1 hypothetical protein N7448_010594 [Penicillium atrosanguineum]KAJ5299685.1 hypothetical protein N7476_011242 [Penicillium atrosanguineum]
MTESAFLVREIECVVTAPYAPSLQGLNDLAQRVTTSTIDSWALQKPCQVDLLADAFVEGLSRSRVALPLLSVFAHTTVFRDALLQRHPVILDTFLQKAVDAEESEYDPACIALLSSPLPPGVVAPARLASFITKLVHVMAGKPCTETLAPLHSLMNSLQTSPRILDEVPSEVMSNLQSEFTKTLRNLDDHMGNLLCLATFARIASNQKSHGHNQHGSEPPSWLLNIKHFFGAKRGLKTLDLVVLRVILACSSNCNLAPSQIAESIGLAICVLDAVELEQKYAWVSSNSSKIAKLCEKVARDGLDRETQVMGMTFLLSLRPVAALPSQIRDLGLRMLVSSDSRGALGNMPRYLVSRLTASLANCDESIVYEVLRFTVDALKDDSPNRGSLSSLHTAALLLSGLQSTESKPVVSSLLNSVSTKEAIASLFRIYPVIQSQDECRGSEVCYCAYAALKNKILLNLFEIYFAASLSNNGNATDVMLMKSFVDRSARSFADKSCSFSTANSRDFRGSIFLRSTQDFSSAGPPTRDWRSGVAETFMQNAQVSHGNMMKKIGDICFDLERRCYEVEGPLRSVEQERDCHIAENKKLKQQSEELQKQLNQSSHAVACLQHDLSRMGENAESASCRVQELTASIESLNQELEDQRRNFENTLHMERETARSKELDFIATTTEKDDQFEELQAKTRRLQTENEEMRQTLDTASKEITTSSKTSASLQNELDEFKSLLAENKIFCGQKKDEVKHLLTDNEYLRMEIGTMKATVEEQTAEAEKLYSVLRETEAKLQSETENLTRKHGVEISQVESEIAKLKIENSRLQAKMLAAVHDTSKTVQAKDTHIHQLEIKIQSLRNERATKAREFSEAQQHIGRLMGVMGFTAPTTEPPIANKYHHTRTTDAAHSITRRQSEVYDDEATQLAESFDSLASNLQGPSPKRPKGNRRSTILPQAPPKAPAAAPRSISPSTAKSSSRHPLAETDFNTPAKSPRESLKHTQSDGNHLQDFDLDMDLEFSKNFIFTSTAFSGSNDRAPPQ